MDFTAELWSDSNPEAWRLAALDWRATVSGDRSAASRLREAAVAGDANAADRLARAEALGRLLAEREQARAAGPDAALDRALIAVVRRLSERTGWARLAEVRTELSEFTAEEVTASVLRLARHPLARVAPDEAQHLLTPADRAAAVHIGDHDCHLISWWGE